MAKSLKPASTRNYESKKKIREIPGYEVTEVDVETGHGLQNTDKSRITDSRMHGKSYKSRTEYSRKYGFGSTLRNTDFLIFPSN